MVTNGIQTARTLAKSPGLFSWMAARIFLKSRVQSV